MRNDPVGNDPKQVWQSQPTEASTMTLEKIQRKAQELHAKTREELRKQMAVLLFGVAFSVFGILRDNDPAPRTAFVVAIVWALAGQYALNRGMWSPAAPADAALTPSLDFYRREIQRRRYLFRRVLGWSLGPLLLAIAAFSGPIVMIGIRNTGMIPNMLPFFVLLLLWVGAFFVLRMRARKDLQREIDELNEIEKEHS